MDIRKLFASWAQSQVDAALVDARPSSTDPPSVSINATHVHIGDINHHNYPGEPERISEPQSRWIKQLVARIGRIERAKNPGYNDARTWTKLNGLAGVDHHRDILKRDFDRVKNYLEGWLRHLES